MVLALHSWRRRKATVFLRRRWEWPQPCFSSFSDESRGGGHSLCPDLREKEEGLPREVGLPLSVAVGMTMVSVLPVSVQSGRGGHGLSPSSLLEKGQGLALALLSWRRGEASVFLRRRGGWPQHIFSLSSEGSSGAGHGLCPHLLEACNEGKSALSFPRRWV